MSSIRRMALLGISARRDTRLESSSSDPPRERMYMSSSSSAAKAAIKEVFPVPGGPYWREVDIDDI